MEALNQNHIIDPLSLYNNQNLNENLISNEESKIVDDWNSKQSSNLPHDFFDLPNNTNNLPKLELDLKFSTPASSKLKGRLTSARKSTYIRRSVNFQLKEKQSINPFIEFKEHDDYRFYLRSNTQVLYSSLEIDSKHIDLINQKPNIKLNEERWNKLIQNSNEAEWISNSLNFVSNKLKNHKEKHKQIQILRVNNQENRVDNVNNDKKNKSIFGLKYEGVEVKTYLRGNLNQYFY